MALLRSAYYQAVKDCKLLSESIQAFDLEEEINARHDYLKAEDFQPLLEACHKAGMYLVIWYVHFGLDLWLEGWFP